MTLPVPPREIGPGLWHLGGHHLCVYLIRGQGRSLLFEVGVSVTPPLVLAQLAHLRVPPEEVSWVVLTHPHSDHSPGAPGLLAGLPRARLVLTSYARDLLGKRGLLARYSEYDAFCSNEVVLREGLSGGPDWPPMTPPPEERLEIMEAGQSLNVGGRRVEFLPATGHTPGGLLAWLPEDGVLLSSDSTGFLHPPDRCGFLLYFVSYGQYRDDLAALRHREPEVLGLGHQGALAGATARNYMAATAEHLDSYHRQIVQRRQKGQSLETIAQWLYDTFYIEEITIYHPDNILPACAWLTRRSLEHAGLWT